MEILMNIKNDYLRETLKTYFNKYVGLIKRGGCCAYNEKLLNAVKAKKYKEFFIMQLEELKSWGLVNDKEFNQVKKQLLK